MDRAKTENRKKNKLHFEQKMPSCRRNNFFSQSIIQFPLHHFFRIVNELHDKKKVIKKFGEN